MNHKSPYRLFDWERQSILDAYVAGEKIDAIAAEFGVSRVLPGKIAQRRGIPTRPTGRPRFIPALMPSQVSAFV